MGGDSSVESAEKTSSLTRLQSRPSRPSTSRLRKNKERILGALALEAIRATQRPPQPGRETPVMPVIRQIAEPSIGLNDPFVWNGGDAVKNSSATKAPAIVAIAALLDASWSLPWQSSYGESRQSH